MDKFKITKKRKLTFMSFLWIFASINILKISMQAYKEINFLHIYILCILSIFLFFSFIFTKTIKKQLKNTLDKKTILIIIFMMTIGILIRKFNLVSNNFIFIFYCGLGLALFIAGIKLLLTKKD